MPSWQDDYERMWPKPSWPANKAPVPVDRQHAMWVVTHALHTSANPSVFAGNATKGTGFSQLGIPQLAIYKGAPDVHGLGEVVVVSPSMPSGGVTSDGKVQ